MTTHKVLHPRDDIDRQYEKKGEDDSSALKIGGARGVMVIVVGNGHSDTSSNPGRDWLHFT